MKLYKYVPFQRISFLQDRLIRFTQPHLLNDPWEIQTNYDRVFPEGTWEKLHEESIDEVSDISDKVFDDLIDKIGNDPENREIIEDFRQQFASQHGPVYEDFLRFIEPNFIEVCSFFEKQAEDLASLAGRQMGVLSLAELPDDPTMWAHYADEHRGFVIEFDSSHPFFTGEDGGSEPERRLHKIAYADEPPKAPVLFPDTDLEWAEVERRFFTKHSSWTYEKEWRVVRRLKEADKVIASKDDDICLFEVPAVCVTGVVLGCRMAPDQRQQILDLLNANHELAHVVASELVNDKRQYKLILRPVAR